MLSMWCMLHTLGVLGRVSIAWTQVQVVIEWCICIGHKNSCGSNMGKGKGEGRRGKGESYMHQRLNLNKLVASLEDGPVFF